MKFWVKALIVGSVSFIVLTAVAMFIAHGITNDSNSLTEGATYNNKNVQTQQINPQVAALMQQEIQRNSIMASNSQYTLDD